MPEHIAAYIREVSQLYQTGITTEHSFRPALQRLLRDCTRLLVINEQSHIECGAPDLTLLANDHLAVTNRRRHGSKTAKVVPSRLTT